MVNRLSLSFCICALFLTIPQGVCRISIKCIQIRCDVFGPSPRKALYRRGLARNSSGDVEAQSGYRSRKENDGKEISGQRSMGLINKFAINFILRCTWCINHDRVLVSLRSPIMAYISWFSKNLYNCLSKNSSNKPSRWMNIHSEEFTKKNWFSICLISVCKQHHFFVGGGLVTRFNSEGVLVNKNLAALAPEPLSTISACIGFIIAPF